MKYIWGDVYESLSSCTPEYMKKEKKKTERRGKIVGGERNL